MRRMLLAVLASSLVICQSALATWSIVVVNTRTGEVAVATATCNTNSDLLRTVPLIRVGLGAAAAQSFADGTGENRLLIWNELEKGTPPEIILELLRDQDGGHETRQYGIVDRIGRRVTFTGQQDGPWAGGVAGDFGELHYAIQGNVLAGQPVVDKAEAVFLDTRGDLAEKLMAAMEAAAAMGGDGRCSCRPAQPDDCGAPPPKFEKSAHVGCMVIARLGDTDGTCMNTGCANGEYYMKLNIARQRRNDPDPVLQLRKAFTEWRRDWEGEPDHLLSRATFTRRALPADGTSQTTLVIELIDWRGLPVPTGGADLVVEHAGTSAGSSTIGEITDRGAGLFEVTLTAGTIPGDDELVLRIEDAPVPVTLFPNPRLHLFQTPAPTKRGR